MWENGRKMRNFNQNGFFLLCYNNNYIVDKLQRMEKYEAKGFCYSFLGSYFVFHRVWNILEPAEDGRAVCF